MRVERAVKAACLLLLVAAGADCRGSRVLESVQTTSGHLKIRAQAYNRNGIPPSGYYYVFESSRSGSDNWAEILTVTTEGRLDALQRIHFLNDRTAYLSAQWQFAVTIDGGDTWRVWDAYRELRSLGVSYQGPYIRSASLSPDGNGSLVVIDAWWSAAEFSEAKHLQQLHTRDFGQHWSR
jgi:hypothetical protein